MIYTFELENPMSAEVRAAFPELNVGDAAVGGFLVEGEIVDQAHLHSVLDRMAALGLALVGLERRTGRAGGNTDAV